MRDWWTHTDPMLAGLWGGIAGVFPDMTGRLAGFIGDKPLSTNWDQYFLRDQVWPAIRDHVVVHDRCYATHAARPFPTPTPSGREHVGQNEYASDQIAQAASLSAFATKVPALRLSAGQPVSASSSGPAEPSTMPLAYTRAVSPRLAECALTHLDRQAIDPARAAVQHAAYEQALADAGFEVVRLPELAEDPDAVFVEDTALLLGGHAVITRPGAASRADEVHSTADGLEPFFTVHHLGAGVLDGGDVLRIGTTLYVGQSSRTDAAGTAALADLVAPLGFTVVPVELGRCLHLKTAVTYAGRDTVLINPDWVYPALFVGAGAIAVDALFMSSTR